MKLDQICRVCLLEKTSLNPIFSACVADMLMTCTTIQVIQGDGLPHQICTQCLQSASKAYSFKQLCEKSDSALRQYVSSLGPKSLSTEHTLMIDIKTDQLLSNSEVLQESVIFQGIFADEATHSLVDNFTTQNDNVPSDLAETMQSLQTIAEQCLPETWETDTQLVSCHSNSDTTCSTLNLPTLYKCHFCENVYKDDWTLSNHMKLHTGQSKYFCAICSKGCNTTDELDKHSLEHAVPSDPIISSYKKIPKIFPCDVCNRTFLDSKLLRKHLRTDHFSHSEDTRGDSTFKFSCAICNKRYKQKKMLSIHMSTHTGERQFSCEVCHRNFTLASSLHKHRKLHSGQKKYECAICGKTFLQSSNLNSHISTHTGVKPYICTVCCKGFSTNLNLSVHMRTHTGEKPFKCTSCEMAFATNTQLKKHIRRHTGEKPYHCDQCGKSFRLKETRDTHVRYHTGERPYACSRCPKKYIAPNHLRVHMKTHNADRKYQCNICLKKFVEAKTLKNHLMTHTGQKLFCCTYCNRKFSHSGSLNTHIKKCHQLN